jgi:hypothetical protein
MVGNEPGRYTSPRLDAKYLKKQGFEDRANDVSCVICQTLPP